MRRIIGLLLLQIIYLQMYFSNSFAHTIPHRIGIAVTLTIVLAGFFSGTTFVMRLLGRPFKPRLVPIFLSLLVVFLSTEIFGQLLLGLVIPVM